MPKDKSKIKNKEISKPVIGETKKAVSLQSSFSFFLTEFRKCIDDIQKDNLTKVRELTSKKISDILEESGFGNSHKVIFLIQDSDYDIASNTLDDIYSAVKRGEKGKDILMILNSPGGYIGPAYFISTCCKEYSNLFCVSIPRRAKSAATLIALGADQIHMGSITELGPIDPQIRKLPALALGEAVEFIASISEKYPGSSDMFARFLSLDLDLQNLGHTRRIADSAVDYATRLLGTKKLPKSAKSIGQHLVTGYKDHGFVIDKREAELILGEAMIKSNTLEYELADRIYKLIEEVKLALWVVTKNNYSVNFVGDLNAIWFV